MNHVDRLLKIRCAVLQHGKCFSPSSGGCSESPLAVAISIPVSLVKAAGRGLPNSGVEAYTRVGKLALHK